MRTLVLAGETPLPATSGMRLRMLHLARQLGSAAEVEVAALGAVEPAPSEPFRLIGVPHRVGRARALAGSLTAPYMAAKASSGPLGELASQGDWSTVQAEFPWMVPAGLRSGATVILDAHNVESDLLTSMAEVETRPAHRARWRWEAAKMRRYEAEMAQRAAAVCATSDADAAAFEGLGARRVVVVPNGVDTTSVPHAQPANGNALVYVGHFGYQPNQVAARELAEEILPRVRAEVPDASLTLVGRDPGPAVRRLTGPGVEVTGSVPEVLPHLRAARVLVVPLRSGSGTRLKVLEAMAAGVPVVSTPLGVAGIELRDGEHVLLAESAAGLAEQAVRVIRDDALAARLSAAGRELVEGRYDWSAVARPLIALHEELAGRP